MDLAAIQSDSKPKNLFDSLDLNACSSPSQGSVKVTSYIPWMPTSYTQTDTDGRRQFRSVHCPLASPRPTAKWPQTSLPTTALSNYSYISNSVSDFSIICLDKSSRYRRYWHPLRIYRFVITLSVIAVWLAARQTDWQTLLRRTSNISRRNTFQSW